jgi:spermidine synthase
MISESKAKLFAAACAGFTSIVIQTILLRRLMILFDGSELVLAVCLACWLLGLALGARAAGKVVSQIGELREIENLVIGGVGIYAVLALNLIERGRELFALSPGEPAGITALLSASILALCISGAFFGALFPLLATGDSGRARKIYVNEALGGFAGGLVYTFLFTGYFSDIFSLSLCGPVLAITLIVLAASKRKRPGIVLVLMIVYLCLLPLRFDPNPDAITESEKKRFALLAPGQELLAKTQTPYAEYLLGRAGGEKTLFISGRAATSFPAPFEVVRQVALYASALPELNRVLMVGGAAQGQLAALLKFPLQSVEYLEHDPALLEFLNPFLSEHDARALRDPRVRIINNDPRRYIADEKNGNWDLVVLNLPEPTGLGLNRYFTEQFYRLLSDKKKPPVVVTYLSSAPNYLGGEVGQVASAIYRALKNCFDEVAVIPGMKMTMFAGRDRNAFDLAPGALRERYLARGKPLEMFDHRSFEIIAEGRRIKETTQTLVATQSRANDDFRPVAAFRTLLILLRSSGGLDPKKLGGSRAEIDFLSRLADLPGWIYLLFPGLFIIFRFRPKLLAAKLRAKDLMLVAAGSGFYGFVWQFVILYGYQNLFGSLYGKLGLLIALYFAGLAVGAGCARRIRGGSFRKIAMLWQFVAVIVAGGPILLLWLPLSALGELIFYLATLAGAAAVGFEFALILGAEIAEKGRDRAGAIYAADNAGGMIGSMLVGLFLLPLTGIYYTLILIAGVKITSVLYLKKTLTPALSQRERE